MTEAVRQNNEFYIGCLYGLSFIRSFTKCHSFSADGGRIDATGYVPKFWSKSNCVYTWLTVRVYTREYSGRPKCISLERDWKQQDRHAVYVIAQQYSFTTCPSLRCLCYRPTVFPHHLPVITLSMLSPNSIPSPPACHYTVYVIAQQYSFTTCLSLRCRIARKLSECL
jgi:hypothetical protein